MFAAVVVSQETVANDFVRTLETSKVNFIYVDDKVTIIKTDDTAEAVDALLKEAPENIDVTVVTYKDTGQRKPGWKLEYEE
jgi:hypothetical protein